MRMSYKQFGNDLSVLTIDNHFNGCPLDYRSLHTSAARLEREGWLSKLLMVRKIDPGKESHSRLLSDTEIVYEMQSLYQLLLYIIDSIIILIAIHSTRRKAQ